MVIDVFKHVPFEDAANIGFWAESKGFEVREHNLYGRFELPSACDVDFAVVMGGPMNIYEQDKYPWLAYEKEFISKVIDSGKCAVGVCLGAQLIADVLGGKVSQNKTTEIGWWKVKKSANGFKDVFKVLPDEFMSFHWHGDRFEIPEGAIRLAGSKGCDNQAFSYGENVLGMQFHIEYSRKSIYDLIENCRDEMDCSSEFVQSEGEINSNIAYVDENQNLVFKLLDEFYRRNFF